jgi:hypothetical protein
LVVVGYVERVNPAIMKLVEIADLAQAVRSREIRVGLTPSAQDKTSVVLDLASDGIDMGYHLFRVEPKVINATMTAEHKGDPEFECTIELDYGHTHSHIEARYSNLRRRRLEVETQQEYYEITYTPSSLKIGFPPPEIRKKPRSFEDLEQLSRNFEMPFDLQRKEPISIMLKLFAESVKEGSVVEPLCNAEQGPVIAKAIDDARKVADYRLAGKAVT